MAKFDVKIVKTTTENVGVDVPDLDIYFYIRGKILEVKNTKVEGGFLYKYECYNRHDDSRWYKDREATEVEIETQKFIDKLRDVLGLKDIVDT